MSIDPLYWNHLFFLVESTMPDYIPDDIWPEILIKSNPETLIRCSCVCKSWRSLITSPSFIASHLAFQKPLFLARESINSEQIEHRHEHYALFRPQTLPSFDFRFRTEPQPQFRIIGTVNGVICLADQFLGMTETIVLWNPLIRRYVYPPTPNYSSPTSTLALGFDPREKDLKIVRISRVIRGCLFGGRGHYPPKAEVFSLRDWKWRSIDYGNKECFTFDTPGSQCLLNGAAHWAAFLRSTRNVLLSFHFEREVFEIMELPQELRRAQVSVSKLGNRLSVLRYKQTLRVAGADGCEVWAMQEYGAASSWCKTVSISWEGGGLRDVMWVREDGGEMIIATECEEVVCYDPRKQVAKSTGIRCKGDGYFADAFVESLVLLDVQDWDSKC